MTDTSNIPALTITPTPAQWAIIQLLDNPFIPADNFDGGTTLSVYNIEDDEIIELYTINPDGNYSVEQLQGLHQGWQTTVLDGRIVDDDDTDDRFYSTDSDFEDF